jgi:PIN domain nuclease of toxin-antitoxin system
VIYLDTHAAVRLYLGDIEEFSPAGRNAIDGDDDLRISPAVVLELEYLHEIGRLRPTARRVAAALGVDLGLKICDLPFPTVVEVALKEKWTRDPFDRLIVAHARANAARLLTRDSLIQHHYVHTIW